MAHLITSTDGMIYAGAKPWHDEGTSLPRHCTPAEALKHAGLQWEPWLSPISYTDGDGQRHVDPSMQVVYRSDNGDSLGIVSKRYTTFSNAQMVDFMEKVTNGRLDIVETAGSFSGGKRVWFLLNDGIHDVAGVDPIVDYNLFTTSHDGTASLTQRRTPIRVVCANTFNAAIGRTKAEISIAHRGDMNQAIEDARELMESNAAQFRGFMERAEVLAHADATTEWVNGFFADAYTNILAAPSARKLLTEAPKATEAPEITRSRELAEAKRDRTVLQIAGNFEDSDEGRAHSKIARSKWAAFNAVTRYVEHDAPMRGGSRLESNLIGSKSQQKSDILELALA